MEGRTPGNFANNKVFQLKLFLIGAAGVNALASLAIWIAVIRCGRLLAYT